MLQILYFCSSGEVFWFQVDRLGVIGLGRLGRAIVSGLSSSGSFEILASVRSSRSVSLKFLGESDVKIVFDNKFLVEQCGLILLCVKPSQASNVLCEIGSLLRGKILVSMVALLPFSWFRQRISDDVALFRAMTNINVLSNSSFTALSSDGSYSGGVEDVVENLFKMLGDFVWVDEEVLDALTIVSGCGPALIAELIDAFILGALSIGVPEDVAKRAVFKLFEGTVKSLEMLSVSELRDCVITPRGLTIKMLKDAYARNVKLSFIEILESTYNVMLSFQRSFQ